MSNEEPPVRRARRGSGAVTLHDVAKLAGVAPITASRALSSPRQVSAEVLQKVTAAVERTGYVRNVLAGGLASTRSRLVAAVVPTIAGQAWITGFAQYVLDPSDPFPEGFTLGDIWGG